MKRIFLVLALVATLPLMAQNDKKIETIAPGIYKITVGTPDTNSPFEVSGCVPNLSELNKRQNKAQYVKPEQIQIRISKRGCLVEVPLQWDEQIYGLGLQIGSFQQKGLRKRPLVNDNPLNNLGYTHAPQTFYVSNKGYGVIVNTARYTTMYGGNLQSKEQSKSEQKTKKVATSTEDLYSAASSGNNVQVDVPGATGMEIFLICGDNMRDVLEKYNLMCGGGALPPMWGLGVKYRMKGDSDEKAVRKMANYFRDKQIPCDVLGLEPGWQTAAYSCSYVWNKDRFPQPETMIQDLGKQNYKVNLWEHGFVNPSSPIYDSLMNYSGNFKVWNGLAPDFLTKEGASIFKNYHRSVLVEKGISGFKLDECDNSNIAYGSGCWSFPDHSVFPSGLDGEQMHQLFGSLYLRTMNSIYRERNQRTYMDYRSGNLFLSNIPATLYSDIYGHRDYIQMICNSGFAGLLWSPELRESGNDTELLQRLQTLLMSSQVILNCWYLQNPPWLQYDKGKNNNNEFLSNATELENTVRELLNQRMGLIPYLYTAFAKYHFNGIPPFRALVVDYPNDDKVFGIDNQFMMGDDMMAAPFYEGAKKRKVYFPEGVWYDFHNNKMYQGDSTYVVEYRPGLLPLFVKENAIIPYAKPVQAVAPETVFDVECRVYGNGPAKSALYSDDGETYSFEKGHYSWSNLTWDGKKGKIQKQGQSKINRYKISSWSVRKPATEK